MTVVRSISSFLRMRSTSSGLTSSWNAASTAATNAGTSSAVMVSTLCSPAMAIGIITGSGTYALPGFESAGPEPVATDWGDAFVSRGTFAGVDVLHISRHHEGHQRL